MKTSDLRLGNWVNFKGENKRVTTIDEEHLNLNSEGFENSKNEYEQVWHSYDDKIEPIPLTPDILLKAGFVKGKNDVGYHGYSNGLMELDNDMSLTLYDGRMEEDNTKTYCPPLEFLHQLQNLHYSLTGVELDIKL